MDPLTTEPSPMELSPIIQSAAVQAAAVQHDPHQSPRSHASPSLAPATEQQWSFAAIGASQRPPSHTANAPNFGRNSPLSSHVTPSLFASASRPDRQAAAAAVTAPTGPVATGRIRTLRDARSFEAWQGDIIGYASVRGLLPFLEGTASEPTPPSVDDPDRTFLWQVYTRAHDEWRNGFVHLRTAIYESIHSNLANSFSAHVSGTPHELYEAIRNCFQRQSYTQQCAAQRGILLRLTDCRSVEDYHSKFRQNVDNLSAVLKMNIPGHLEQLVSMHKTPPQPQLLDQLTQKSPEHMKLAQLVARHTIESMHNAYLRAFAVSAYLNEMGGQFSTVVEQIKSTHTDPRSLELEPCIARVMEAMIQRNLQSVHPSNAFQQQSAAAAVTADRRRSPPSRSPPPPYTANDSGNRTYNGRGTRTACDARGNPTGHPPSIKCWVKNPDEAPPHRQNEFRQKNADWRHRTRQQSNSPPSSNRRQRHHAHVVARPPRSDYGATAMAITATEATTITQSSNDMLSSWVVDSGATIHITGSMEWYTSPPTTVDTVWIKTAKGMASSNQSGEALLHVQNGQGISRLRLSNVHYLPGLGMNLISVRCMLKAGLIFRPDINTFTNKHGDAALSLVTKHDLWMLKLTKLPAPILAMATIQLWHQRLAHAAPDYVRKTVHLPPLRREESHTCHTCELSKSKRRVCNDSQPRPTSCFDHIATDLCGPIKPEGIGRKQYLMIITCRASSYRWGYLLREKSEAVDLIRTHIDAIRLKYNIHVKSITTDGGLEFSALSQQFPSIEMRISAPHTPEQNGTAEKANHIIVERARSMIIGACLPASLWPEITQAAIFTSNHTFSRAIDSTPVKFAIKKGIVLTDKTHLLRVIGCKAFTNIASQRREQSRKFAPRAEHGVMVGYHSTRNYRIWIPSRHVVTHTPHVRFDENCLPYRDEDARASEELHVDDEGEEAQAAEEIHVDHYTPQTAEEPHVENDAPPSASLPRRHNKWQPQKGTGIHSTPVRRSVVRGGRGHGVCVDKQGT
jgi:hypothetical protein